MPENKICGDVIYTNNLKDLLKKVRNDVCNYRCKWAMICQDKKNLAERHCCVCEMSKLADLLKGGEDDG